MAGALRGVRVLAFGRAIAGSLLGVLLADQGADVIKVEPPAGEPARADDGFEAWNRGTRSLAVDLADATGRERLRALVAEADVLVEDLLPGELAGLGLGWEALSAANPGLVYCALPGFGEESPYRGLPAVEGIVGARAANYRPTPRSAEPVYTALPISSAFAAMLGAASVTGALLARGRDGLGQYLEVPLHAATFVAMGSGLLRWPGQPEGERGPRPLVTTYACADGRYVQFHAGTARFARDLCAEFNDPELTDLIERQRSTSDDLARELHGRLQAFFKTRPAAEWEALFMRARTPGLICRTVEEFRDHPHAAASGTIIPVDSPALGPTRQAGPAVRLHGTPGAVRGGAPLLNDVGAGGWGQDQARRAGLAFERAPAPAHDAPLAGVRVLDLTIQLAGPVCARTLAEFGADVIKIDNPYHANSAAFAPLGPYFHLDTDRGKRTILLDLKAEQGRAVFWRLAERADVIVQNFRLGAIERLGLGYEAVRARRPDIIYASINAYGQEGPWAARPGWEVTAQAFSGSQVRIGGRGKPPATQPFAVNDYGTGVLAAYSVLLALFERARTGRGQAVSSALIYTAAAMQAAFMLDYPGRVRREAEGQEARGESARSRLYQAADGWLYLHLAGVADLARLRTVPDFAAVPAGADDAALAGALSAVFAMRPVAEWCALLTKAGIAAVPLAQPAEFFTDPTLRAANLVVTRPHAEVGELTHLGIAPRLARTPLTVGCPVEPPGASGDAILAEHGYSAAEIAALHAAGAVR